MNIGIFRIDRNDQMITLVNATSIRQLSPPFGNANWFSHNLEEAIYGEAGDYVGIFYDNWRTVYSNLVIRSANPVSKPESSSFIKDDTLVFRYDARSVVPGTGLSMSIAEVRRRLPALIVNICRFQAGSP